MQRAIRDYAPYQPLVKASMPPSPETGNGVVISYTANHVLWWIHAICQ
jgi:hypothetical protein